MNIFQIFSNLYTQTFIYLNKCLKTIFSYLVLVSSYIKGRVVNNKDYMHPWIYVLLINIATGIGYLLDKDRIKRTLDYLPQASRYNKSWFSTGNPRESGGALKIKKGFKSFFQDWLKILNQLSLNTNEKFGKILKIMRELFFFSVEFIYPAQSKLLFGLEKKSKIFIYISKPLSAGFLMIYTDGFRFFWEKYGFLAVPEKLALILNASVFLILFYVLILNILWIYGLFFEKDALLSQKQATFVDWVQNQALLSDSEKVLFLSNADLLLLLPPVGIWLNFGTKCVRCVLGVGVVSTSCILFDNHWSYYSANNRRPVQEFFHENVPIDRLLGWARPYLGMDIEDLTSEEKSQLVETVKNKTQLNSEINSLVSEQADEISSLHNEISSLNVELAKVRSELQEIKDKQNQSWLSWSSWSSSWGGKKK